MRRRRPTRRQARRSCACSVPRGASLRRWSMRARLTRCVSERRTADELRRLSVGALRPLDASPQLCAAERCGAERNGALPSCARARIGIREAMICTARLGSVFDAACSLYDPRCLATTTWRAAPSCPCRALLTAAAPRPRPTACVRYSPHGGRRSLAAWRRAG